MDVAGKTVVLTGGASGIGAALARRMVAAGAQLLIADRNAEGAADLARDLGCESCACDVTRESDIQLAVARAQDRFGPVDMFVSNAGLGFGEPGHAASASNEVWQLNWDVHVMSHVYAARAVLPDMIARGSGYLVQMASAAGLLCQIGDAAYSATKHAAVSFAESLSITHGSDGIRVSVVCPQYVATPLIGLTEADAGKVPGLLGPDEAAAAILKGVAEERFLILTHPVVAQYVKMKSDDYERWLQGMRLLRAKAIAAHGQLRPEEFYKIV